MNENTIDQALRRTLFRHDCPEPLTLGDYHLALLDDATSAAVARHVARCPHCESELAGLAEYLAPSTGEALSAGFRLLIARLVDGLALDGSPTLAPALAFRGTESETKTYQAEEHLIAIIFGEDIAEADKFAIDGYLIGPEYPAEFRADLWHDETWVATALIDELGNFTFAGLTEEDYELIVRGPRLEIHIAALAP